MIAYLARGANSGSWPKWVVERPELPAARVRAFDLSVEELLAAERARTATKAPAIGVKRQSYPA